MVNLNSRIPAVSWKSYQPFYHVFKFLQKYNQIIDRQRKLEIMCDFVVTAVPADGLAPLSARTSAGTVMTKFETCRYMGPALAGWTFPLKHKPTAQTNSLLKTTGTYEIENKAFYHWALQLWVWEPITYKKHWGLLQGSILFPSHKAISHQLNQ